MLFIFLLVSGFCTNSNRDTSYLPFEPLSVDESVKKSKKDNKPILLYFHANWCGICHTMNQTVYSRFSSRLVNYLTLTIGTTAIDKMPLSRLTNVGVKAQPTTGDNSLDALLKFIEEGEE